TPGHWLWELPEEPASVAISSDASLIAVGFAPGTLRVYDRGTGAERAVVQKAHGSKIKRLAFNAAGTLLASASFDKAISQKELPYSGWGYGIEKNVALGK